MLSAWLSAHCSLAQIISVVLCLIALIYLLADGEDFKHALGFIVVLLVASIPIAIEIVRCTHPLCCHLDVLTAIKAAKQPFL